MDDTTTLGESWSDGRGELRSILHPGPLAPLNSPRRKHRSQDAIDDSLRTMIRDCADGEADWPLVLWGDAGSGKTCAGLCIVDHYGGWAIDFPDLHRLILDAQRTLLFNSAGYVIPLDGRYGVWDQWERATVTVLDEVGQRSPTDPQYETLKRALDLREGLPAVVISNLPMPDLERVYDRRIVSRLSAGTVVGLKGDRRLKQ